MTNFVDGNPRQPPQVVNLALLTTRLVLYTHVGEEEKVNNKGRTKTPNKRRAKTCNKGIAKTPNKGRTKAYSKVITKTPDKGRTN